MKKLNWRTSDRPLRIANIYYTAISYNNLYIFPTKKIKSNSSKKMNSFTSVWREKPQRFSSCAQNYNDKQNQIEFIRCNKPNKEYNG